MNDTTTTLQDLKTKVKKMVDAREWRQFHSPKNLSMAIVSEAAELLDLFRWATEQESEALLTDKKKGQEIRDELADTMIALLTFAAHYDIDISTNLDRKLREISDKYPVKTWKGRSGKYTEDQ